MKFSNFHKSNPNLLYNEFKGLEDYTQDDYLLLNFKKKNPSQKKNLPLLPIGLGAETSNLVNL